MHIRIFEYKTKNNRKKEHKNTIMLENESKKIINNHIRTEEYKNRMTEFVNKKREHETKRKAE